ncbi:hypothetical protein [Dysgonomonas sp. 520]|uniref:hypothetical protein n=1 Tax=Dysgonomonas sp. 520 TaxID=2302931 RepID=UPI0013CF6A7F|nr:hypothetical protein [Dysgonomonas sp. 520]NDW08661.1 hypothetical protein [Dysgonomonas sp. 520]
MRNLKVTAILLVVCMSLGLVSCGGEKSSKEENDKKVITLTEPGISGDLSEYFEIVGTEFEIQPYQAMNIDKIIEITIKRTDVEFPYPEDVLTSLGGSGSSYDEIGVGFGYEMYDKDGIPLNIWEPEWGNFYFGMPHELLHAESGRFGKLKFSVSNANDETLSKIVSFKITTKLKIGRDVKTNKKGSSGANWDTTLNDFEKAINSLYKDISNADNLNAVENLQSQLEYNRDKLTDKQVARLDRLIKRID